MKEVPVPRFSDHSGHETGPIGIQSFVQRGLIVSAVIVLLVAAVAACGGSDDSDDGNGPNVVMSTFTPVPPDFTPEVVQTRSARETEFAQTATAQPNAPTNEPSTGTPPSGSQIPASGTPMATPQQGEVRPPEVVLRTPGGQVAGVVGDSNYLDPQLQAGASIDAPYVPLPGSALSWAVGSSATFTVANLPYPVRSASVEFFSFDENVARPTNPDGSPTGELAFFPQIPPAQQIPINGSSVDSTITVTPEVAPGNYIVTTTIVWDVAPEIEAQTEEQFTQYVYVVRVG